MESLLLWRILPFKLKYIIWIKKIKSLNSITFNEEPFQIEFNLPVYKSGDLWSEVEVQKLYFILNDNWNIEIENLLELVMRKYEVRKSNFFINKKSLNSFIYLSKIFVISYEKTADLRYINSALKVNDFIFANWYPDDKNILIKNYYKYLAYIEFEISKLSSR